MADRAPKMALALGESNSRVRGEHFAGMAIDAAPGRRAEPLEPLGRLCDNHARPFVGVHHALLSASMNPLTVVFGSVAVVMSCTHATGVWSVTSEADPLACTVNDLMVCQ